MFSKTAAYQSDVIRRAEERALPEHSGLRFGYSADLGSEHPKKGLRGAEFARHCESNQDRHATPRHRLGVLSMSLFKDSGSHIIDQADFTMSILQQLRWSPLVIWLAMSQHQDTSQPRLRIVTPSPHFGGIGNC